MPEPDAGRRHLNRRRQVRPTIQARDEGKSLIQVRPLQMQFGRQSCITRKLLVQVPPFIFWSLFLWMAALVVITVP